MKIGIVGTGAMGCVYAALLGDAGNEVWAVDSWVEHVAAMAQNGLTLEGASGTRTVKFNATTDAAAVGPCDLIIIATKAMDVAAAAQGARAMLGPDTVVLTIQNGLGSAANVAAELGAERVVLGVAGGFGASITAPGKAHHNGMEVMMYDRYPLSLRQVEDLLFERGIDICCETVGFRWNRFGPIFAAGIRKRRTHHRFYSK